MAPFTRSRPRSNSNNKSSSDTPSEPVIAIPTSSKFRRKRGDRLREQSDIHEEAIPMRGPIGATREPSFTKIITSKTAHHSAYCCRLALPRRFCEEHKLPKHVSMTDSTENKRWHMRFQLRRSSRSFTISNGWREFSYDHSLETGDELVFTLVSPSHFRVGFVTSNGTRAMYPTRDGGEYPWKINYSRLDCLSKQRRNNRHSKKREESEEEKDSQEETQLQTLMQPPEARPIQGMEKATTFMESIVSVLFPETPKPAEENSNLQSMKAQSSEDRLPEGGQEHSQLNKPIVTIPSKPTISLPNESKEQFCQCKTSPVMLSEHQPRSLKVPRITHVECKNPDGTTYLQIIDSDGEVAN